MLDIIALITYGETAIAITIKKSPIKSPSQTPKESSKHKRAQPSGDVVPMQASEEPKTKRAKSDQAAPQKAVDTLQTSPNKKKKKSVVATRITPRKSARGGAHNSDSVSPMLQ